MRGQIGVKSRKAKNALEFIAIALMGILFAAVVLGCLSYMSNHSNPARTYEEGFKAGMAAAVEVHNATQEDAALMWWAGSPDLAGARQRLCWNYYPQKKEKK